jgi:hypothetical protein
MDDAKIEHRMQELREKAGELANAQAMRYQLDHARKAVLAISMKSAEKYGHKSVAAQEREAYASAEYDQWLHGSTEAVRRHERLRLEFKVIELRFEAWRTMQSTRRAEMNLR